jgi:hypothetical protein
MKAEKEHSVTWKSGALPPRKASRNQRGLLGPEVRERRRQAVTIPFYDRVIFVSLLNCAEFSSQFSEGTHTQRDLRDFSLINVTNRIKHSQS